MVSFHFDARVHLACMWAEVTNVLIFVNSASSVLLSKPTRNADNPVAPIPATGATRCQCAPHSCRADGLKV